MNRSQRGRANLLGGAAAEEVAARRYEELGGRVLARRWRGPEGELDLVVALGPVLVFVEVKRRRRAIQDDPVGPAQWRRLAATAERYMMAPAETGASRPELIRFDVALVGPEGGVEIIENACRFDEQ